MLKLLAKKNSNQKKSFGRIAREDKLYKKKYLGFGIAFLFLFITFVSNATTYYVSNSGNDSNNGTSESSAWKTLDKVNSFFFSPGDNIFFKKGDTWNGTIRVRVSGTSEKPITYGAYGSGSNPKIYGSKVITGWTLHSGNIYKAKISNQIKQIFVDDVFISPAKFPNDGYVFPTSMTSQSKFSSTGLDGSINYAGATIIARSKRYKYSGQKVASSSGTTLTLDGPIIGEISTNEGFILTNKLAFLDSPGEWFYDNSTETIYLWLPNNQSPSNHRVSGTVFENNVYIESKSYITFKDLDLSHSGYASIYQTNSKYITINNCDIKFPNVFGVRMVGGTQSNITFTNNTVTNSSSDGLSMYCSNSVVSDNKITNIGLFNSMGFECPESSIAVKLVGDSNKLTGNTIENVAYNGISFRGNNMLIEYNYLNYTNKELDDGAAIYTYQDGPGGSASSGSVIRNNIVTNIYGNPQNGIVSKYGFAYGIYLDKYSHDIIIEGNTVAFCTSAITLGHATKNNVVRKNTFMDYALGMSASSPNDDGSGSLTENIFYSTDRNGTFIWWRDKEQRILRREGKMVLTSDRNNFVSHYSSDELIDSNGDGIFRSFANWKSETGQDLNSTIDVSKLSTGIKEKLFYNNTKQSKTYLLGGLVFKDIFGKLYTSSFTLQPFTSKILIGANIDKVVESIVSSVDLISPVISSFSIPETSNSLVVPILSFIATDNNSISGYKITETSNAPKAGDSGWQSTSPSSYTFSSAGTKTLYAWVKDAAGNVSGSLSDRVDIGLQNTDGDVGGPEVYGSISTDANQRAMPITSSSSGEITSISIYHEGGTGKMLLGVYSDDNGIPTTKLGMTSVTTINSAPGWQTVNLTSPVSVSAGETVWLSWVFENNPGIRYTTGLPGRASSGNYWSDGFPVEFGNSNQASYKYSIYCSYSNNDQSVAENIGYTEIYGSISTDANQRAMPITSSSSGEITSISIYHEGGNGKMLLGVYSDVNGIPSTRLGITSATTINSAPGWQTVDLISPISVSAGETVWLSWVFEDNPGIRYTTGSPGRASSGNYWSDGFPVEFGNSKQAYYKYSIYCRFSGESLTTGVNIGNTEIYGSISTDANQRAMPITSSSSGEITSISIYHEGGTGKMLLGVYSDENGTPTTKLGMTSATTISSAPGWQTVNLTSPVTVSAGETVWLSWVFEDNPGIRYTTGSPGRASSGNYWSDGFPIEFGNSKQAYYKYSIYCRFSGESLTTGVNIGNTEIYGYISTDANQRAMPVTFSSFGEITSISIYHEGGTGKMLLGVYSDENGTPTTKLGMTSATTISSAPGWQTVNLTSPVTVSAGETVWLSWVFEKNPGIRYTTGSPGRASSGNYWSDGFPVEFGNSNQANYKYSIYCRFNIVSNTKSASIFASSENTTENDLIMIIDNTEDLSSDLEFNLFPNPASTYINLEFMNVADHETRVQIIDSYGRVILNEIVRSAINNINISQIPAGLYYVKSQNNKNHFTRKLIINR